MVQLVINKKGQVFHRRTLRPLSEDDFLDPEKRKLMDEFDAAIKKSLGDTFELPKSRGATRDRVTSIARK